MLLLIFSAHAADLSFSPDRPGVGDSTGTVGAGHLMLEGGLLLSTRPGSFGTSGLTARVGVDRGVELRLRMPDVGYADAAYTGDFGIGAKIGGALGERWSVSVVPELSADPNRNAFAGSINGNMALALDPVSFWAHSSVRASAGEVALFLGGGMAVSLGSGGAYLNAGGSVGELELVGAGGWMLLSEGLQVDAGLDVVNLAGRADPVLGVGLSAGW